MWRIPERNHGQSVEQHQFHLEQRQLSPQRRGTPTAHQQRCGAQQQHDQLQDNGDREDEQRQNQERNARLREHGRKIGNRQRLPEQDAAIATFAVQRVEQ
jgi:hypothetical protein